MFGENTQASLKLPGRVHDVGFRIVRWRELVSQVSYAAYMTTVNISTAAAAAAARSARLHCSGAPHARIP